MAQYRHRVTPSMLAFGLIAWLVVSASAQDSAEELQPPRTATTVDAEAHAIVTTHCLKCHGPTKQKGGIRFDSRNGILAKGDSGESVVVPSKSAESELIRRVTAKDDTLRMPPGDTSLTAAQIETLRKWIDAGAAWSNENPAPDPAKRSELVVTEEDRQHWTFRPLANITPPEDQPAGNPIDRFIFAKLTAKGLTPAPAAKRERLIRRVTFDLTGLPPTPEEVEAFVQAGDAEAAYEALVDRLLASPHYGERWGRHWLDLTRYADSDGLESDADRPNAYHYRDFVIRALNDDLPFQTFVRWQLAGDEYEPDHPQAIAATGFLTTAPIAILSPDHLEEERLRLRFNELDDTAVTTSATFLGLTLGCARCHDHKFDPIPTRDYYRMQAAFIGTVRGNVPLASRETVARFRQEDAEWNEGIKRIQKRLDDWLAEQRKPHEAALRSAKIDALPIGDADKTVLKEQPDSDAGKRLRQAHGKKLELAEADFRRVFKPEQIEQWDALKRELDQAKRNRPKSPPAGLAITEPGTEPRETWLLSRGDFHVKQERVELGFFTVLTGSRSPEDYWAAARREATPIQSTFQRRAMAEWITDPEQGAGALLARVFVNRVWQHHFGEGLSRTVNDFGVRGERPSHPELLEWLANDFVSGGWRLKRLHKLILMSAVYRQDTTFDAAKADIDPDNRFLWRRRPRRLESEILRDAVLAVSGTLNLEAFGPAFKPPIPAEAMQSRNTKDPYPKDAVDNHATRRRSVYMFHKRVVHHPLMQVFDGPDASASCGRRSTTTVAPQALALLNDVFIRDRAADLGRRLVADAGEKPNDWVTRGFRLALSRTPTDAESADCVKFLERQIERRGRQDPSRSADEVRVLALTDFCQALFSLNEFIYVD